MSESDAVKSQAKKDAEWEEHIRALRAQELAKIHGTTPEAVRAHWANENAIRQAEAAAAVAAGSGASLLAPSFTIESEMRGETIHYIEPARRTSMMFFWT